MPRRDSNEWKVRSAFCVLRSAFMMMKFYVANINKKMILYTLFKRKNYIPENIIFI